MSKPQLLQLGRYRIAGELGRGAMGVVYKAEDPVLNRTVAVKTILMPADAEARVEYEARFFQEAKAAAGLNHPNIVTVHDAGREGDVVYMTMELLDGVDLRDFLKRGRVPLSLGLDIAAQLADGLAVAHDQGVVHRDIKPANIMVRDGRVLLIDVFFVQVRPSPWRQAVDLANMMLVLAVRTDAARVYRQAVNYFTPDEVAEAFAATRGVASPTQLRQFLKRDRRDLISEFRALTPPRRPIVIQRWSARRVAIALAMLLTSAIAFLVGGQLFLPVQDIPVGAPGCGTGPTMILTAQAVPSATRLPCIAALPTGWSVETGFVHSSEARFTLGIDKVGASAVEVTLTSACDVSSAERTDSDEPATQRFDRHAASAGRSELRMYRFAGGCVTYRFSFPAEGGTALISDAEQALGFEPRDALVGYVDRHEGLALCGAGAPCPP
jgi:tRNA A-37 threonylcarbamoyl transferase component Bud32